MATRILVVEDDGGIAKLLRDNLTIDGFEVKCAATAHDALTGAQSFHPDLVLLDLMLPDGSGFDLCRVLRQGGARPLIIVSAKGERPDKVKGLDLGADDYVTKPFDMEELVARINAVLRRSRPGLRQLKMGDITVDFQTLRATRGEKELHLTFRDFEVLKYLAERSDRVVRRDELLADVWGVLDGSTTRSADFAISRLRKKIEPDPHSPRFIRTVHGDGYSLAPTEIVKE